MNELTEEQKEDKFRIRTKMAIASIVIIISVLGLTMFTEVLKDKTTGELDLINACVYCFCSVILAYFGVTAWHYKGK